jgi:hypothetical protein
VHGVFATAGTLATLACRGEGPLYKRQGQRLTTYHRDDLDAWAATRKSRRVRSPRQLRPTGAANSEPKAA